MFLRLLLPAQPEQEQQLLFRQAVRQLIQAELLALELQQLLLPALRRRRLRLLLKLMFLYPRLLFLQQLVRYLLLY